MNAEPDVYILLLLQVLLGAVFLVQVEGKQHQHQQHQQHQHLKLDNVSYYERYACVNMLDCRRISALLGSALNGNMFLGGALGGAGLGGATATPVGPCLGTPPADSSV